MISTLRTSTSTSIKWSVGGNKKMCSKHILEMKGAKKEVIIFTDFRTKRNHRDYLEEKNQIRSEIIWILTLALPLTHHASLGKHFSLQFQGQLL